LLVWDKDSYTERFLALLPCICVLQPTLVHHYQTSSLLSSHLPIVTSVSLRLLHLLLYIGHIYHFQVLGFLPFPISPMRVPHWVCDQSPIILLHLFWAYNLHMRKNIGFLAFYTWLTSLKMMLSSSTHLLANDKLPLCINTTFS
jgi:hypothetical protein